MIVLYVLYIFMNLLLSHPLRTPVVILAQIKITLKRIVTMFAVFVHNS